MKTYLGIDIGTTNCKACICDEGGRILDIRTFPTPTKVDGEGYSVYDPAILWDKVEEEVLRLEGEYLPSAIGIAGMAEAGVLININTGEPASDIIPWFDKRGIAFFDTLNSPDFEKEQFFKTGLHNSYKYSTYKLLMLSKRMKISKCRWLSLPGYIAYKLTGSFGDDYTLALRTYGFNINDLSYDAAFINHLGFEENIFSPPHQSGEILGYTKRNTPVSVCGHDHMCAAYGVGAVREQDVFVSMGTTAVILGNFPKRLLTEADFKSGYSYGLHVIKDKMTWLGSIQAAGGAIDWCLRVLGIKSYGQMKELLSQKHGKITELLFFPYLNGSGAPMLDINVKGSFLGLDSNTDSCDMLLSVLEGISLELRLIIEGSNKEKAPTLKVVGGVSKNVVLMQLMADVLGAKIEVSQCKEATAVGAAMLAAGINTTAFAQSPIIYNPEPRVHEAYSKKYLSYKDFQLALRKYFSQG